MKVLAVVILTLAASPFCWAQQNISTSDDKIFVEGAKTIEDLRQYGLDVDNIDPALLEDAFLTTPQLIEKYGYPVEVHSVQTPDGYILEIHRIPNPGGIPVFLQHGLIDSSAAWIFMGPKVAFAYHLHEMGYDVWMGNIRGNRYSRKHTHLSTKSREFWEFSFDEIGTYDVPSMIDYVLRVTKFPRLHYVGHSQGTASFFVMCTQRPGYCNKIISMHAFAPVAFMKYLKSPLVRAVIPFLNQIDFLLKIMGNGEFLPSNDFFKLVGNSACKKESALQPLCYNALFLLCGYNSDQLDKDKLPAILGHYPAGSSTKQFIHFGQLIKSGRFRKYDYGTFKNLRVYGTFSPPSYDLKKVTAPVVLHYSKNDWLSAVRDVEKLQKNLPNVKARLVPHPKFNHVDYLAAKDSRDLLHIDVVKAMKGYEQTYKNIKWL